MRIDGEKSSPVCCGVEVDERQLGKSDLVLLSLSPSWIDIIGEGGPIPEMAFSDSGNSKLGSSNDDKNNGYNGNDRDRGNGHGPTIAVVFDASGNGNGENKMSRLGMIVVNVFLTMVRAAKDGAGPGGGIDGIKD